MGLQRLSANVNRRAGSYIKRIILGLCMLAGIAILVIIISNTVNSNVNQVKLYRAEIDNTMSEKVAFIDTVAAGVASGVAQNAYYDYLNTMVELHDDVSAVYVCMKETGTIYSDGIMTYMSGGWVPDADFVVSGRSWYVGALSTDGVYVSEPYVDEQTGNICITLSKAIYRNGEVAGVAGLDMYMEDLVSLLEGSYDGGNYVFLVTDEGTILTHPTEELALRADSSTNVVEALNGKYEKVCRDILKNSLIWDYKGGFKLAICDRAEATGWKVVSVSSLTWSVLLIVTIVVLALGLGIVLSKVAKSFLNKGISPLFKPLESLASNVSRISAGDLEYDFEVDEHSEEVHALSEALNEIMKELRHYISEITNTVTAISEKNLNFTVDGEYAGDYEKIKTALVNIMQVLNESFTEMNKQASTVLLYSENLSDTSENVAESATSQSESVLSASNEMKRLTENMVQIANYASSIKENTDTTNERLTLGSEEMQALAGAMEEIAGCYEDIAGFVSEINEIASQTNLLSLNASIEAARAGEVGRGFAVVAGEISSLSESSSRSSAKISETITRSLQAVERGRELMRQTSKTIQDGVGYSVENAKMINEIVNYVETQKGSADEISVNLKDISVMVENNAASAQENSAISTQLGECAKALMDTIAQFQLQE